MLSQTAITLVSIDANTSLWPLPVTIGINTTAGHGAGFGPRPQITGPCHHLSSYRCYTHKPILFLGSTHSSWTPGVKACSLLCSWADTSPQTPRAATFWVVLTRSCFMADSVSHHASWCPTCPRIPVLFNHLQYVFWCNISEGFGRALKSIVLSWGQNWLQVKNMTDQNGHLLS